MYTKHAAKKPLLRPLYDIICEHWPLPESEEDVQDDNPDEQEALMLEDDGYGASPEEELEVAKELGIGQSPASPNLKSGLTDDLARLSLQSPEQQGNAGAVKASSSGEKMEVVTAKAEAPEALDVVEIGDSPVQPKKPTALQLKAQRIEQLKLLGTISVRTPMFFAGGCLFS